MKSKKQTASDLEGELLRLNTLVRQRREQLGRLEKCPHKDCECRVVWRQVVEDKLASQVGKIRKTVKPSSSRRAGKAAKKK